MDWNLFILIVACLAIGIYGVRDMRKKERAEERKQRVNDPECDCTRHTIHWEEHSKSCPVFIKGSGQ